MTSEMEQNQNLLKNDDQTVELNNRIKTDFMSHCYSFLNDDDEGRQCVDIVWNKYLECVGDVATVQFYFLVFVVNKIAFFFSYRLSLIHFHII